MKQSRRSFIRQSALASTAFGAFTISGTKSSGKIIGANDRINVAVCGIKDGELLISVGTDARRT